MNERAKGSAKGTWTQVGKISGMENPFKSDIFFQLSELDLYLCNLVSIVLYQTNTLVMNRILYLSILMAGLCFAVASCAKQGFPSGGPKDETPPVVLGTQPPNGTLNFNAKEFVILFDEYVTMKDVGGVIVSPTMDKKAEFGTRGHGLVVKIKDTLQPATTYLFQFKNAIADFNEGNLLPSFEYVFSTGNTIDSMTLRGQVMDAFDKKPRSENIVVVAYAESQMTDSLGDSLVAKVQPMYMTRPDKEGYFELNHLREGLYILLAIEDGDKNMRLGNDEAVAFLDTMVTAEKMPPPPDTVARDTAARDTTAAPHDSLRVAADSLATDTNTNKAIAKSKILLLMSQEKKEIQRISKNGFLSKGRIEIVTKVPLSRHYALTHLTYDSTEPRQQIYHKLCPKGDTLNVWVGTKGCDSIALLLKDTTGLNDTLRMQLRKPTSGKGSNLKNKGPMIKQGNPVIMRSMVAAKHPYFDTLWIAFNNPIKGIGEEWATDSTALDTAVQVLTLSDSSRSHCGIKILHDSTMAPAMGLKAFIAFNGKAGEKYQFKVPAGLFYDIWLNKSDSLSITTEYTKTENYGNIALTLLADSTQPEEAFPRLIVQLTNEKGDMVQQQIVSEPCKISFLHLKGGKYGIRAIVDSDGNGVWTPGNYWQHRQPEKILLFEKTLELRENWDMEEKWSINGI